MQLSHPPRTSLDASPVDHHRISLGRDLSKLSDDETRYTLRKIYRITDKRIPSRTATDRAQKVHKIRSRTARNSGEFWPTAGSKLVLRSCRAHVHVRKCVNECRFAIKGSRWILLVGKRDECRSRVSLKFSLDCISEIPKVFSRGIEPRRLHGIAPRSLSSPFLSPSPSFATSIALFLIYYPRHPLAIPIKGQLSFLVVARAPRRLNCRRFSMGTNPRRRLLLGR